MINDLQERKALYREAASAVNRREALRANPFFRLFNNVFLLVYFCLLPVLTLFVIHWTVYALTAHNFYQEPWMTPFLLLLSTFLSGAFIRQKMEDETGGIGLFVFGLLALIFFAWLTWYDIQTIGSVYSHFLPKRLSFAIEDYLLLLPAVGIVGMLAYKHFTLKHYG